VTRVGSAGKNILAWIEGNRVDARILRAWEKKKTQEVAQ
jgi:hypothetical protein